MEELTCPLRSQLIALDYSKFMWKAKINHR